MSKITQYADEDTTPCALVDGGGFVYKVEFLTQDEVNEKNENMPHSEFYWTPVELHFPAA